MNIILFLRSKLFNKFICYVVLSFIFLSESIVISQEKVEIIPPQEQLFPLVLYYPGIGLIYGGAYLKRELFTEQGELLAAVSAGQVEAVGFFLNKLGTNNNHYLNLGGFYVNKATMDISFTRDIQEEIPFRQNISAQGITALWNSTFTSFHIATGIVFSRQQSDAFFDRNDKEIILPNIRLTPLTTTVLTNDVSYRSFKDDNPQFTGYSIGLSTQLLTTATEYSSTLTNTLSFHFYIPFNTHWQWATRSFYSQASVVSQKTTDENEIRDLVGIECEENNQKCKDFLDSFTTYIRQHNLHGTARPLGGSNNLHSYRELRFRAAHSAYLGNELRYNSYVNTQSYWQLVLFTELGDAQDEKENLLLQTVYSHGLGLRYFFGASALRLECATHSDANQCYFVVGNSF